MVYSKEKRTYTLVLVGSETQRDIDLELINSALDFVFALDSLEVTR